MSMNLDKPLDDIIKSNPKRGASTRGRKGRRSASGAGGAKAAAIGGKAANAATAAASAANRNKPLVIPGRAPGGNQSSKIIVSNLPLDVTEAQVKELFSTTIGPLRRIAMSFRANGQSTGQVTIEFQRGDDGMRAYQQYNNRLIDGKKSLRVEVVVDPTKAAVAAGASPAASKAVPAVAAAAAAAATTSGRGGARGGRGRGRGRGGRGGAKSAQRPKKSAEDLDAEMEDYSANKDTSTAAAAAPAAPAPAV